MTEKEVLITLINRLDVEKISALKKVVEAMVYPLYPEEELTPQEEKELSLSIKEIENGAFVQGKDLDELFE